MVLRKASACPCRSREAFSCCQGLRVRGQYQRQLTTPTHSTLHRKLSASGADSPPPSMGKCAS